MGYRGCMISIQGGPPKQPSTDHWTSLKRDAGNIELMTIKERDTESRTSSMAYEEIDEDRLQAQTKTDIRCIPAKTIIWITFKSIVFLICVIVVVIQSVEFYNIYSEYPTNMVQKSIFIKKVKLPALTLCLKYM
ncbi:hypothetical protein AVEN_137314-1 [Araneus ventricosus]|uniref:Uncharacterized protein n=1 Tax=Araneus ventricosus TaxID=182803 RepID=A0A4Y2FIH5_ARAVE|nr:hypothetical protein AVEN_137314-1 [Araneus ventricosus]